MFQAKRQCIPEGCKETISYKFLKYILRFHKDKRPEIQAIIERNKNKSVILHSSKEVVDFLNAFKIS